MRKHWPYLLLIPISLVAVFVFYVELNGGPVQLTHEQKVEMLLGIIGAGVWRGGKKDAAR